MKSVLVVVVELEVHAVGVLVRTFVDLLSTMSVECMASDVGAALPGFELAVELVRDANEFVDLAV